MYDTKKTPSSLDDYIASLGRNGDTLVAHLSPEEAELLKKMGGSGGINPKTGMLEFWGGSDGSGGGGDDGGYGDSSANGGDPGGFGGPSDAGMDGGGDSFGYGGYDPSMGDYGSLDNVTAESLSGMNAFGKDYGIDSHTQAQGWGTPGYIGATMRNEARNISAGFKSAVNDPMGFIKSHLPSPSVIGYGLAGLPGAAIGMLVSAITSGDWGRMSPEAQAEAISLAENQMGANTNGSGNENSGLSAPYLSPSVAPDIASVTEKERRRIVENPYTFNQQMVGLSNRDVPYVRRG